MTVYLNDEWLESPEFPFYTALYPFEANEYTEPHSHEFIEIAYVAQGTGLHTYQGHSYPISRGDVFIIEPGVVHDYQSHSDSLSVHNVLFQPSLLESEWSSLSECTSFVDFFYVEPFLRHQSEFQSHLVMDQQESLEIHHLLSRMLKEYASKKTGYRLILKNQLVELLIFLSRCYETRGNKSFDYISSKEEIIDQICKFIEIHHAQPLSLRQVSQLCGMSQSLFSSTFKRRMNKTFVEYRNQVRISVAKQLLRNRDEKVISIAGAVGFEDLSFFNKLFKQETGMSPAKYRKSSTGFSH